MEAAEEGTFVWLPHPIIAARRCCHHAVATISLAKDARLPAREELVFGRHGELPGTIRQRLRVTLGGRPLYDQELCLAFGLDDAWKGPAVTGGRRVIGSALVVDPGLAGESLSASAGAAGLDLAIMPLSAPAVLVTALADDALTLRRRLDDGLASLQHEAAATYVAV